MESLIPQVTLSTLSRSGSKKSYQLTSVGDDFILHYFINGHYLFSAEVLPSNTSYILVKEIYNSINQIFNNGKSI